MALPSSLLLLLGSVVAVPIQAELLRLARRTLPGATERKRMEAALAESEARFRVIADSLPHLAWLARPDGSISWCNRRWLDYAGATQEQMRVRGWHALQHPDHLERVAARIRRIAESGEPWEDSFPLRRAEGEWRWFHVHVLPVRDAAILDVNLGRRSVGLLANRLAARGVPILFVTGYGRAPEGHDGAPVLAKPCAQAEVAEALRRLLPPASRHAAG